MEKLELYTTLFGRTVKKCSVRDCHSVRINKVKNGFTFHYFPKCINTCKEWIKKCDRGDLCSKKI